jgi:hypothetical protein
MRKNKHHLLIEIALGFCFPYLLACICGRFLAPHFNFLGQAPQSAPADVSWYELETAIVGLKFIAYGSLTWLFGIFAALAISWIFALVYWKFADADVNQVALEKCVEKPRRSSGPRKAVEWSCVAFCFVTPFWLLHRNFGPNGAAIWLGLATVWIITPMVPGTNEFDNETAILRRVCLPGAAVLLTWVVLEFVIIF